MHARTFVTFVSGLGFGVALLLACSDDAPGAADAQVACDCPAAEPPIAPARFEIRTASRTLLAGQSSTQGTGCANTGGGTLISGGCVVAGNTPDVDLIQAGFETGSDGEAWACAWQNNTAGDVVAEVQIKCLLPAQ